MTKTPKKERLWIIGSLLITIGAFLIVLFLLSNEKFFFFSLFFPYSLGFFITGLVTLTLGFELTTIYSYNDEEFDPKRDNRTKKRAVLMTVIIIYLISIGYLIYVANIEWEIQALIIQIFDQTYAFYPGFVVSSYQIFFLTLLLLGIFILPAIIVETGFLDDSPSKQINEQNNEISQRELNLTSNRLFDFIRNTTGSIKKYEFTIGSTFTIFGSLLIILPYFLLLDSPLKIDPLTDLEYHEVYYGFNRGQFLLIGLFFLIVGLILFYYYIRRRYSMKLEL